MRTGRRLDDPTSSRPVPPRAYTADELPDGRRENLAWNLCWQPGFSLTVNLDEIRYAGPECDYPPRHRGGPAPQHALADEDGLFHPAIDDRLICATNHRRADDAAPVALIDVARANQCDQYRDYWPGTLRDARLGPVRRQLVETLGPGCSICPNPWAKVIDHDHLTGAVRGYLCRWCNAAVDRCRHLHGCGFAEYLNAPPAAHLKLIHPDAHRRQRAERYRTRLHIFKTVMAGGMSPPPHAHQLGDIHERPDAGLETELLENVGRVVVAAMTTDSSGAPEQVVITRDGQVRESPAVTARLALGWKAWGTVADTKGRDRALAWLVEPSPPLDGQPPVTAIRELRTAHVMAAARAYLNEP